MGTLISTAGGFTNLPATAPAGWPTNLTWPGNASPNGASTMTMSDADFQRIIVWVANAANAALFNPSNITPPPTPPVTVNFLQILRAFLGIWAAGSAQAAQNLAVSNQIAALTPPTPPVITVT